MSAKMLKVALVGGAAVATLALGASQASAAGTFAVKAGNAPSGTSVAITGTTQGSNPQITFVDTTSGTTLNCASGTAAGTTTVGTGLAGAGIGSISGPNSKFNNCTGPLGLNLVVTGSGTWSLNAIKATASQASGTITGIRATVKDTGGACSFAVAGTVATTYSNSAQTLTVPGTKAQLKISKVVGCFGVVNNGDVASFKAVYKLAANTASYNPITITNG